MQRSLLGRGIENAKLAKEFHQMVRGQEARVRKEAQRALAARMGRMRGLPQKIGQAFSLKDEELSAEFGHLQNASEPLPIAMIQTLLDQAWGKPHQELLAELDPHGMAASLGQVHRGLLKDGSKVAIKVAYPGIREAVFNDLKMLGWLGRGAETAFAGFKLAPYRDFLLADLEDELDYEREAALQDGYLRRSRVEGLIVPRVFKELCGPQVLLSQWQDSLPIDALIQWPQVARQRVGTILVDHMIHMLFVHGWMHADPHPGNVGFRLDQGEPKVVLYDYGCVLQLTATERLLLLRLLLQTQQGKGSPLAIFDAMGFNMDLLNPIADKVPALCRLLFEPFLVEGSFDSQGWQLKQRLAALLGDARWNLRFSGIPQMMFLVRGFQGLLYYLKRLKVQVNWRQRLQPVLHAELAAVLALNLPARPGPEFQGLAKHLCLDVFRDGEKKVGLRFPASAVERLEALMGDEILDKAKAAGLEPSQAVAKARSVGFAPCSLIELNDEARRIRIWLE